MLSGRQDIIGDLARLRNLFVGSSNEATDLLSQIELLAAAAVSHGMSYPIVGKASGIPRNRIEALLATRNTEVDEVADQYHRRASGVIVRRSP